jgi:hypothetical protein
MRSLDLTMPMASWLLVPARLQTWAGLGLNIIYGGTAVVALAMAALSFGVTPAQDVNKR